MKIAHLICPCGFTSDYQVADDAVSVRCPNCQAEQKLPKHSVIARCVCGWECEVFCVKDTTEVMCLTCHQPIAVTV